MTFEEVKIVPLPERVTNDRKLLPRYKCLDWRRHSVSESGRSCEIILPLLVCVAAHVDTLRLGACLLIFFFTHLFFFFLLLYHDALAPRLMF